MSPISTGGVGGVGEAQPEGELSAIGQPRCNEHAGHQSGTQDLEQYTHLLEQSANPLYFRVTCKFIFGRGFTGVRYIHATAPKILTKQYSMSIGAARAKQ